MAGLGDMLTAYRSAIASTATLTNLPANIAIDDLPASKLHRTFSLGIDAFGTLGAMHGSGVTVEYHGSLRVTVYWEHDEDEEAIWNTIGTDVENVSLAMLKDSNKGSTGTVLIEPEGLWSFEQQNTWTRGTATYRARYRITQDLS